MGIMIIMQEVHDSGFVFQLLHQIFTLVVANFFQGHFQRSMSMSMLIPFKQIPSPAFLANFHDFIRLGVVLELFDPFRRLFQRRHYCRTNFSSPTLIHPVRNQRARTAWHQNRWNLRVAELWIPDISCCLHDRLAELYCCHLCGLQKAARKIAWACCKRQINSETDATKNTKSVQTPTQALRLHRRTIQAYIFISLLRLSTKLRLQQSFDDLTGHCSFAGFA